MLSENLISLRKLKGMTQETLAEQLEVSRQTLSKYETGESLPDIEKCKRLSEIFDVSIDELVSSNTRPAGFGIPPRGKHIFGTVTIGDRGQIVIPAKARQIFGLQPGDTLLVLGDEAQGLALISTKAFMEMAKAIQEAESGNNT